ncbi:MAG: PAS domain S-box protein [Uliginosibacterium sp.]|nr:PAS domain S-box protein [Uliginosibacterium sp.]
MQASSQASTGFSQEKATRGPGGWLPQPWRLPLLVLLVGASLCLIDAVLERQQQRAWQLRHAGVQARLLTQSLDATVSRLQRCLGELAHQPSVRAEPGDLPPRAVAAMSGCDEAGQPGVTVGILSAPAAPDTRLALEVPLQAGGRLVAKMDLRAWLARQSDYDAEVLAVRVRALQQGQDTVLLDTRTPGADFPPPLVQRDSGPGAPGVDVWRRGTAGVSPALGWRQAGLILALLLLTLYLWVEGKRRLLTEHAARESAGDVERSRDRWIRALESTQDGVWEFDSVARRFFTSPVFLELVGMRGSAPRSLRVFLRMLGKEQCQRTVSAIRAAWEEASRLDELVSVNLADGKRRWIRIRGAVAKERQYFTGAISDVTEEIELARERDRYQIFMAGVIDALPMPISVKSANGDLILVNKLHAQSLNKMIGELVGKHAHQLVDSKMAEQLEMIDRLVLETGRTHSLEDWFDIALAKRRVFLRITKSRCLDENGKQVVVTTYEDQTEVRSYARRLADLNVRVQAFVQRLIETVPHPLYVKDAEGRYLIVNAGLADQWGMRVEDMVGRTARELFGDERGAAIEEEDRSVLAGDVFRKQTSVFHARSAQLRHWAVIKRACLDVDGKQVIVGSNYELTDIRRAELDLRAALDQQSRMRAFLQETFDALPHPLFIQDRKHRYVLTNRAHAAFYACTRDRIIGASSWDFAPPEVAEAIEREEEALFAMPEGSMTESEYGLVDGSGRMRRNLVRKVLSRDADGYPVLIGITIDVTELKDAETREAKLRDFYQRLVDAIPLPVEVTDTRHVYQLVNKAFCDAHSRQVDEVIGKTHLDFDEHSLPGSADQADDALFEGAPGEIVEREQMLRYADGAHHQVVVRKVIYAGPNDERLMVAVHSDMSRLRAAERSVRCTLERLTTLINNAPMGIALLSQGGGVLEANRFLQYLLGYSAQQLQSMDYQELMAPQQQYLKEVKRQEIIGDGVMQPFEAELIASDGRAIPVMISGVLVRDADDAVVYWVLVSDLTERKRADSALHVSEARWQFALEGAGDGVWDWNVVSDELYYSARWQAMLGYEPSELPPVLSAWLTCIHPEDVETVTQEVQRHLKGKTSLYMSEHRLCRKDGTVVWVLDRGKVVERDPGGRALRMIGTHSDITRRKEEEVELRRHRDELRRLVAEQTVGLVAAKEAAEHANAAKTEFLTNVSHELRTPMHAILSFAQMGEDRASKVTPEKLKDYFHRVVISGNRLLTLLDELLDISKLESGRMVMQPAQTDLSGVLDDAVTEFDALLSSHRLRVERQVDAETPACWVDPKRIGQVVRNLLANAIKFTPDGGLITLCLGRTRMNVGRRQGERLDVPAVELVVRDSGSGIPAGELEDVFDKFVQSSQNSATSGGTGLGLAICKAIVHAHRGQIYARNHDAGGAEIVVRMPVAHGVSANRGEMSEQG